MRPNRPAASALRAKRLGNGVVQKAVIGAPRSAGDG